MSEDGSTTVSFQPDYEESTMEIVVETLTGTTFEMAVLPTDTIMSIKSKIHRVEGIPVTQQHLLHRMSELNNDDRLCDHGVTTGSTLRLVLSMRGGPISTRRLTSSEHHLAWRELREYVDNTREDIVDKLPPGAKVTVLLFREGENINLIRVVENEDGTCYPYSDSCQPPKTPHKETSQIKYRERSSENTVLMHKVVELRRKMEGLSMQKKVRKPLAKTEDFNSEPSTSRLHSDTLTTNTLTENNPILFGDSDKHLNAEKNLSEFYSDRLLLFEQRRNSRFNIGRSHRPHRIDDTLPKVEDMPITSRNCTSIKAPSIAILEEESESALNKKESDYSPPSPISIASGDSNTVTMSQIPSLPSTSRNLLHLRHVMLQEHTTDRPKTSPDKYDTKAQEFCNVLFNDAAERSRVKLSVSNRRQSLDFSSNNNNNNNSNLPRVQYASNSNSRLDTLDKNSASTDETSLRNKDWQHTYSQTLYNTTSNLLTSQYASTSKLNSVHLDNVLGNRVTESPNSKFNNERRSPLYGRRARIERIRNNISESSNPEKYGYSNLGYIANIEKIQNDAVSINKQAQYGRRSLNFVSNIETRNNRDRTSYELRPFKLPRRRCNDSQQEVKDTAPHTQEASSSVQTLPAIVIPKKPARPRCSFCNKRLNITTIHTCRCGGVFCSQHRYSEVHRCQYDYKTEGRKILEQANPLVAAPKLPKI